MLGGNIEMQLTWWTVHQTWGLVYEEETNNKWTYGFTDHLIVDLGTIIELASMAYIVDLKALNKLHPGDEKVFNNFVNEC